MTSTPNARVGVFLLRDFQELEFWYPVLRLREDGIPVTVLGLAGEQTVFSKLGYPVVAEAAAQADLSGFTALVVPGVVGEGDAAERKAVVEALRAAHARGAVVAASGSSVALLEQAGIAKADGAAPEASPAPRVLAGRGVDDMPAFFKAFLQLLG